ncbi:MAG: ABC transporter ATP-binding protein [Clostridiaceae bacterium]
MENVLKATNLKKIYGSKGNVYTALDDINLDIKEGEFIGIMGPSGAGKTTLLNIISTIDKPTSGSVVIDNEELSKMKEDKLASFRRNKLGFIFQDFNLLDTLTLKENIALPLALSKVNVKEIDKRVYEIADTLGIRDILNKYPYEVSGGQKQRAAASRAIITKPKLILADEPTGALDSKSSSELLEALSELNTNHKATIMLVTHDAFAASYCKRILFIKDGVLYTELVKGKASRREFFQKIFDVLSAIGGGINDIAL